MNSPVDYTSRSGVASIMLASTETGNALSPELLSALTEAIERAERDASCRAILLVAAGPSFSQGADFTSVFTPGGVPDPAYTEVFLRCMQSILRASRPVIACVEGKASGGGVGLVSACDLVIASEGATFVLPEVLVGMIPALITPFLLRRLSPAHVRALTLSARSIDAREAQRLGLVDEIAEQGLAQAVQRQLERVFRASPAALAESKQYFERLHEETLKEQTKIAERRLLSWLGREDVAEGIQQFADGFSPPWFQRYKGPGYICPHE